MGKKISLDAAAEELGMSKRSVRRLISTGQLRAYRIGRQMVRIDCDDLAAALKPIVPTIELLAEPVKRISPTPERRSRNGAA